MCQAAAIVSTTACWRIDVGWMDDRTAPSLTVRHNIEGLTMAFPPAYLLSFVIDSEQEPIGDTDNFSHCAKPDAGDSRAHLRVSGPGFAIERQPPARDRSSYKRVRDIIAQADAILLGPQAIVSGEGWDALQELTDDRQRALIFAFKGGDGAARLRVKPINLIPDATYDVSSFDKGSMGKMRGSDLMIDGVELAHDDDDSSAHVVILSVTP